MIPKLNSKVLGILIAMSFATPVNADSPVLMMQNSALSPVAAPPTSSAPNINNAGKKNMAKPKVIFTKPECVTPTTNNSLIEGRRAFVRMNCYSCHGADAHGGIMGPSLIGTDAQDVKEAVLYGEGEGMPAFKRNLCPNDLNNLVSYIQSLNTINEPHFNNWWEPGPSAPSQ